MNIEYLFTGVDLGTTPIKGNYKQNPNHLPPLFTGVSGGVHYFRGLRWVGPTNLVGNKPYVMANAVSNGSPVFVYRGDRNV